ncbi:MAG: hypothetical protein E7111_01520 [Bacteroidales bacterium]|nr:hypothetical protein [Bacteroidales bacterium]
MRIKTKIVMSVLMAGLMSLSCAKENCTDSADGLTVITAEFPVASKVAVTQGSSALNLSWQKSDYITVVSGTASEKYTLVSISGSKATFKGNPVEGTSFDVILSRASDYRYRSYSGQVQTAISSTDHLLYDAVLKGVTSYSAVTFTDSWAQANGGELLQNGCLLLHFYMPEDAGKLQKVTLTAPSAIFYQTNSVNGGKTASLTLDMANVDLPSDYVVKAHIMTSMQEASIPSGTQLTLTVVSNLGTWSKKFTPGASVLKAGHRNVMKLNGNNWILPSGDGSAENPYIIRTKADLFAIKSKLSSTKKYFALVNNIDMNSEDWTVEITNTTPIDFNGNNRTIDNFKCHSGSYRGLIRILNGSVTNLNITHANVDGTAGGGTQPCGIIAGYCGNNGATAEGLIENCYVQGTVKGNANGVGGMVGVLGHGSLNRCCAAITVTNSADYATGGLVGCDYDNSANNMVSITNCWSSGTVQGGTERIGGIIGVLHRGDQSSNVFVVSDCYSKAHVKGEHNCGGIVGHTWNKQSCTKIERCIAWNEQVTSTNCSGNVPGSGAIVGVSRNQQYLLDCYRRPDLSFTCTYTDLNYSVPLSDQENTGPDERLPYSGPSGKSGSYNYIYPYHGKAAGSSETLSAVAKRLGWNESVWNLSGDTPALKR